MIQRILDIIRVKKMSPAQFAEEVGIQRSSISHLVSGRNKPSLEFIQKLLATFPDISTEWLITGKGEMFTANQVESTTSLFDPPGDTAKPDRIAEADEISLLLSEDEPVTTTRTVSKVPSKKKPLQGEGKQVDRIVYFFKDNTFREFYPES